MNKLALPTHTCFDDALDYIADRVTGLDNAELIEAINGLFLVHAICIAPDGHAYAHAWVEDDKGCIDRGEIEGELVYYIMRKEEYYKQRNVQERTVYSITEACEMNVKYNTYGPWRAEYIALCTPRKVS